MSDRFDVILLAAQRSGVTNPLATKFGVSHKCIIPVDNVALIERVLKTLSSHPSCRAIHILIEADGMAAARPIIEKFRRTDLLINHVTPSNNIAESVLNGCRAAKAPYLITTADNVLLSHHSINMMLAGLADSAAALAALARQEDILAVHPEAQKFFYRFQDGGYANCNLYAISAPDALDAIEVFREGGQFMKHPMRLIRAFGFFNILTVKLGFLTVDEAFRRASKRFGVDMRAIYLKDGTQAIDVDNERTYRIVEGVLKGTFPATQQNSG